MWSEPGPLSPVPTVHLLTPAPCPVPSQMTSSDSLSLLSMSHSYIIVPRDVPPENFKSVPETLRVKRRPGLCVVRSLLLLTLLLCLTAGAGSGLYLLAYEGFLGTETEVQQQDQFVGDQPHQPHQPGEEDRDHHEDLYLAVRLEGNLTEYRRRPSPCAESPCSNGGLCESHDGVFSCHCGPGYHGQLCQVARRGGQTVSLGPRSHISLSSSLLSRTTRARLRLSFRPTNSRAGLILLTGRLAILLQDGFLVVKYQDTLYHHAEVSLAWHNLTLSTYHSDIQVQLDHSRSLTESLPAGQPVVGDLLCLGDCLGDGTGLQGCVRDLTFGQQPVSLVEEQGSLITDHRDIGQCSD